MYKHIWYCRWCRRIYKPINETDRDGFCSPRCKQAHYRARKKYVTGKTSWNRPGPAHTVTQKKRKKRK